MLIDFLTVKFAVYLIRWIISGFVMLPFMLIMKAGDVPFAANVIIGQIIGAFIFYKIDGMIFKIKNKEENNNA